MFPSFSNVFIQELDVSGHSDSKFDRGGSSCEQEVPTQNYGIELSLNFHITNGTGSGGANITFYRVG